MEAIDCVGPASVPRRYVATPIFFPLDVPPCAAAPMTGRRWSNCAATSLAPLWLTNAYRPTPPGRWI